MFYMELLLSPTCLYTFWHGLVFLSNDAYMWQNNTYSEGMLVTSINHNLLYTSISLNNLGSFLPTQISHANTGLWINSLNACQKL